MDEETEGGWWDVGAGVDVDGVKTALGMAPLDSGPSVVTPSVVGGKAELTPPAAPVAAGACFALDEHSA